jgi:hypothetical protein
VQKRVRKTRVGYGRGAAVAIAGVLATTPAEVVLAAPTPTSDATTSHAGPTPATAAIDDVIAKLSPGALKRVLKNLRAEDSTKVAQSHDTFTSAPKP